MNVIFLLALQETPVEEINFGMLIVKMIFFLGVVVALIYLVLKKLLPLLFQGSAFRGRSIRILERVPVDQRRSLLVVEVQDKVYLLGSAEGQINVLMELDREKLNAKPTLQPETSGPFEQVLKKAFMRRSSEPPKS
jgi:flagellar protein FliO/FliZ